MVSNDLNLILQPRLKTFWRGFLLSELMSNEEALKSMIGELEGFESFKLPSKKISGEE